MQRVTKTEILRRLTSRFSLENLKREMMTLQENIIPTTSIDDILKVTKQGVFTVTASAVGWVTAGTVPAGKRWKILCLEAYKSTGTFTMTKFGFQVATESSTQMTLKAVTAATDIFFYPYDSAGVVSGDSGDKLTVYVDTHSVAGNLQLFYLVSEEDLF